VLSAFWGFYLFPVFLLRELKKLKELVPGAPDPHEPNLSLFQWVPLKSSRHHISRRFLQNAMETGEEILMPDQKKCANPACSCVPANKEKFCSPHCEGLKGSTEVMCTCGHPDCKGNALRS
jgi:hypothetical protein